MADDIVTKTKTYTDKVRNAMYGKEVRSSIADSIDKIAENVKDEIARDELSNDVKELNNDVKYLNGDLNNLQNDLIKSLCNDNIYNLNIWDEKWEIIDSYLWSKNYIKIKPNTKYKITTFKLRNIHCYDSNYLELALPTYTRESDGISFTLASDVCYIKFDLSSTYGQVYKNDISIINCEEEPVKSNRVLSYEINNVRGEIKDEISKLWGFKNTLLNSSLNNFFGGVVSKKSDGSFFVENTTQNDGCQSNFFYIDTDKLGIDIEATFVGDVAIGIGIVKSDGSTDYSSFKIYSNSVESTIKDSLCIDLTPYIIYKDAKKFIIYVNGTNTNYAKTINISKFEIYERKGLQTSDYYSYDFKQTMERVFKGIDDAKTLPKPEPFENLVLTDTNGSKYKLKVYNGQLTLVKTIPDKVLLIGNSLLLGMDTDGTHGGAFGMAATDSTKDYAYYVEQAIIKKNSNATFDKLHIGDFEMLNIDAETFVSNNISHLANDTNLIILQCGDNVSKANYSSFKENYIKLLIKFRSVMPNAVILCVGAWFYTTDLLDILSVCTNHGATFVDIHDLRSNIATIGETITYKDGTTCEMPSAWATHPGNLGMKLIAERIISAIDM